MGLRRGVSIVFFFNQLVFFGVGGVGTVCGSSAQKGIPPPLVLYGSVRTEKVRVVSLFSGGEKNKGGPTAGDEEGGSQTGRKFNSLLHFIVHCAKMVADTKKLTFLKNHF